MRWFRRSSTKPLWQDEFSVFTADERYVTRRQLTKFLTLTSLAMFAGNVWILLRSLLYRAPAFPRRVIARTAEIPPDGLKLFQYPGPEDGCILLRTGPDQYVAYSQKCTHLSCAVYYEHESNRLACPCHNGYFSAADGRPTQGPPRRPLPRVVIERRGDELIATGLDTGERV